MTRELEVWLFRDRVGTLAVVEGRLNFWYAPEWLACSAAIALSYSLPLRAEPFDDRAARPFFAGLLPDGDMRRFIAQRLQVSRQNDFALLNGIGGECAGAVTFLKPGQTLPPVLAGEVQWLTDDEVVALLDELPHRPMLVGEEGLRLSLAGAQDKLPVVVDGERIGLPRNGMPSSHILKSAIHAVENSVLNEGFCLALAEAMKLKPARSHIRRVQSHTFLLVERYDRTADASGHVQRLHQEDFCQALAVVPELKYQNEGGPDLVQCFDLVRRVTRPSAPQVLRLLDYVIFNVLIGNHDAHAKNFSLLYIDKKPVLAPLYDALSTAVYSSLTHKMAMKVGSKYKFSEVQARHWDQFAQAASLSMAQTRERVLDVARQLPLTARKLVCVSGNEFHGHLLVEQIISLIEQRSALTIRRLMDAKS